MDCLFQNSLSKYVLNRVFGPSSSRSIFMIIQLTFVILFCFTTVTSLTMSAFRVAKNLARPIPGNTSLFICDIQDRFRPLIHKMETVIHKAEHLNKVCNKLDIPCVITEQYRKAFGATVPEITRFPTTKIYEKTKFSMVSPEIRSEFLTSRKQVQI